MYPRFLRYPRSVLRPGTARRVVLAAGAAGLAATALPMAGAASASAQTADSLAGRPGAAMIAALPQRACPAGTTALRPAAAWHTARGAVVYHYAMASGPGFDALVPPAGFRPLRASNATLAAMHMAVRPTGRRPLAQWTSDMKAYQGTARPAPCAEPPARVSPASLRRPGVVAAHANERAWSGYVDHAAGRDFTKVVAHFTQTATRSGGPSNATMVSWVGLGGWNSGRLLQDGTDELAAGGPIFAWFEYLGAKTVNLIVTAGVGAGADVASATAYSTAAGGTATFTQTSAGRTITNVTETGMAGDYDGTTAEFINERPDQCSPDRCYLPMSNYGTMHWSGARAIAGASTFAAGNPGLDPTGVVMTNGGPLVGAGCGNPNTLAFPESLATTGSGGEAFSSVWCRAS